MPTYFRRCSGIECFNGHRGFALLFQRTEVAAISSSLTKDELRAAALSKRDAMSVEQRVRGSEAVTSIPIHLELPLGTIVAGYSPIKSEIDPFPLMRALTTKGAELALPVIVKRDHALIFRSWSSDEGLVRGGYGIFQPSSDQPEVDPDIVLVPLAAFDRAGHRIGYGRGYYDRTLQKLRAMKRVTVIGLAFAAQEIEIAPALPHDEHLDCVLTERELIDLRRI